MLSFLAPIFDVGGCDELDLIMFSIKCCTLLALTQKVSVQYMIIFYFS